MAPPATDADKKKELKEKLAAAKNGKKEAAKNPKQKAKEQKEAQDAAKAEKEKQEQLKEEVKKRAALKAAQPAPDPGPWAEPGKDDEQIGLHLGVTCDGCGEGPPIVGRCFKCKVCEDFDLCEQCYPLRLDKQREVVAAAAGMPGKGRHPSHEFGPRRAKAVMTEAAVEAEKAAAVRDKAKAVTLEEKLRARAEAKKNGQEPVMKFSGDGPEVAGNLTANIVFESTASRWRPVPSLAQELPVPSGAPKILGPGISHG